MWPQGLETWAKTISDLLSALAVIFALIAGLVAALWAYTKFVIERGLLPGAQFSIGLGTTGLQGDRRLLEILLHIKNVGTSTLLVKNLRIRVLCTNSNSEPTLFKGKDGFEGKVFFPGSLRTDIEEGKVHLREIEPDLTHQQQEVENDHTQGEETRGIPVLGHNNFVLPGVDQVYTYATSVPDSVAYALVWSSFEYAAKPTSLQEKVFNVSRRLGLIQYSLTHITRPHTSERVFRLQ